jgi:hypothetical protein
MKRLWIAPVVALWLMAPAFAQDKSAAAQQKPSAEAKVVPSVSVASSQITPTPEMWFYEQRLREYMDPKLAIRRVAEQRAAQRRARLAAMKWYGYSNLRPTGAPDPYNGGSSPRWGGNNSLHPELWSGYGPTWVGQWPPSYPVY